MQIRFNIKGFKFRGQHSTEVAHLLLTPSPRFGSKHSCNFSKGKIVDVVEVYRLCWLEESGQWLENAD